MEIVKAERGLTVTVMHVCAHLLSTTLFSFVMKDWTQEEGRVKNGQERESKNWSKKGKGKLERDRIRVSEKW